MRRTRLHIIGRLPVIIGCTLEDELQLRRKKKKKKKSTVMLIGGTSVQECLAARGRECSPSLSLKEPGSIGSTRYVDSPQATTMCCASVSIILFIITTSYAEVLNRYPVPGGLLLKTADVYPVDEQWTVAVCYQHYSLLSLAEQKQY